MQNHSNEKQFVSMLFRAGNHPELSCPGFMWFQKVGMVQCQSEINREINNENNSENNSKRSIMKTEQPLPTSCLYRSL